MNKRYFILLALFAVNSLLPADSYTARGRAYFEQAKQHAIRGKNKVAHLWFCFRNPDKCSQEEATQAKRWVYGTSAGALVLALSAIGILVTKEKVLSIIYQRKFDELTAIQESLTSYERGMAPESRTNVRIGASQRDLSSDPTYSLLEEKQAKLLKWLSDHEKYARKNPVYLKL